MGEGTALHGDRSAWNTTDYPDEHARDINDGALLYHNELPSNVNEIMQSDGSNWAATTSPSFAGLTPIGPLDFTQYVNTVAAGEDMITAHIVQGDDDALTGLLRGAYITASNGDEVASGTIRGIEVKARAGYPGETGANVNVLEGISISSDAKTYDVTTHRGMEVILDGGAGTSTLAVGIRIANNFQADRATASYALEIYRDSFDYTADIYLSKGGTIGGATGDLQVIASSVIVDATGTEAFLVRKNADGGDVFSIDTTTPKVIIEATTYVNITNPMATGSELVVGVGFAIQRFSNTAASGPTIEFMRAKGSEGSPSAVSSGVELGEFAWKGWDGDSSVSTAAMICEVDGAVADQVVPTRLKFQTGTAASRTTQLTIWSSGAMSFGSGNAGGSKFYFDQPSASGNLGVILLDQADKSEEFIYFLGTADAGVVTRSIVSVSDVASATLAGYVKVTVNDIGNQIADGFYYMPVYSLT